MVFGLDTGYGEQVLIDETGLWGLYFELLYDPNVYLFVRAVAAYEQIKNNDSGKSKAKLKEEYQHI